MEIGIGIKVDAGNAARKADEVTDALRETERRGIAAGKAMASLGGSFKSLAQAMSREAEMLDRIHGPTKRYTQDLQTLDAMLHKNVITVAEYAEQVSRLNKELERNAHMPAPKAPQPQQAPTMGGFAAAAQGLLTGGIAGAVTGGINMVADKVGDARQAAKDAEDVYTGLTNTALKFATSSRGVNVVMAEQAALATQLRSTLAPTMALYDSIGDATDGLNLSQRELVALTRTLGEVSTLAGKPLDSAGEVMKRLAVAMTSGAAGAGEMKAILRDFPEISEALAASWGTNKKGVIDMVTSGKKNLQDMTDVLINQADTIHTSFQQRKRTHAEEKAMTMEQINVAQQQHGMTKEAASAAVALQKQIAKATGENTKAQITLNDAVEDFVTRAGRGVDKLKEMQAQRVHDLMAEGFGAAAEAIDRMTGALSRLGSVVGDSPITRAFGIGQERAAQVAAARKELEALTMAHKAGTIETSLFNERQQQLRDTIAGVTSATKQAAAAMREYWASHRPVFGGAAGMANQRDRPNMPAERDPSVTGGSFELPGEDPGVSRFFEIARNQQGVEEMVANRVREISEDQQKNLDELTKRNAEAAQRTKEAWAGALGSVSAEFLNMAAAGEIQIDKLMGSIARMMLQMAATQMGGPTGAFLGQLAGGLGGMAIGGSFTVGSGGGPFVLPRAATGADWMVGGAGGTDSKVAMFRVTPGETVHVRTPRQQAQDRAASAPSGRPVVHVSLTDPAGMAIESLGTYEGERAFARMERKRRRR